VGASLTATNFPSSPANGDTHTVDGVNYTYVIAKGVWDKPASPAPVTVTALLVAGGGAGGYYRGTGGGAGGVQQPAGGVSLDVGTTYQVVVGAGGAEDHSSNYGRSPSGSDTEITGVLTATGGGGGANRTELQGSIGGSHGGSKGSSDCAPLPTVYALYDIPVQGFAGGHNPDSSANSAGSGGGGGAGGVGTNGSGSTTSAYTAGDGGPGLTSTITASSVVYAGGGGGSAGSLSFSADTDKFGIGGTGGGGNAATNITSSSGSNSTQGTDGLGGGGGAGANRSNASPYTGRYGAKGGNGVCIIRSATSLNPTVTGSPTTTTTGSDTIYKFLSNGSITY